MEQIKTDLINWAQLERETKKKIPKFNSKKSIAELDGEYLLLLNAVKKSFKENSHVKVGQVVEGVIERIGKREIIVNIDYKDNVFVENRTADQKIIEKLKVGDKISVMIMDIVDNPYQIKGSITELIKINIANKLKDYYNDNIPLLATVKELIPAGFMLEIEMDFVTINAFMPNILAGINRLTKEQSNELIGTQINVLLESLQQDKGTYVVSRKKYLKTLIPLEIDKLKRMSTLYKGKVTGHKDFGVFVEFAADKEICLTTMIHLVNLKDELKNNIESLTPGTEIEFYIRDIIAKNNKIISTQVMKESLWDKIKVGKILNAKVKDIKLFGVLVELDKETSGLIQSTYLKKSEKKIQIGDEIKVKVISVIRDDRKIYLDIV